MTPPPPHPALNSASSIDFILYVDNAALHAPTEGKQICRLSQGSGGRHETDTGVGVVGRSVLFFLSLMKDIEDERQNK